MINIGTKVELLKKLDIDGYLALKGKKMEICAADFESDYTMYELKAVGSEKHPEIWVYKEDFKILKGTENDTVEILSILERNEFGQIEGYGRKLRLRNLTHNGVNIEGGSMGAKFNQSDGLVVWNLNSRSRMEPIAVSKLIKIEKELNDFFKKNNI